MFIIAQAAADDGLTIGKLLGDIPHDAPAIVVYVMVLLFAGLIWAGSRKKST